ncbi:MAG TPA: phosphoenolpyruvate--protein phosphotransferase [Planctomycetota bacterium]|jgi:phosphotransferase system enzyme I (PtsI)|nr:phosphoenolpyruvate--protein phosphotransferase [Planctomycetota bacterium]
MAGRVLKGIPVSPGIAIGSLFPLDGGESRAGPARVLAAGEEEREIGRLRKSVDVAEAELERLRDALAARGAEREGQIFRAQRAVLHDPSAREEIERDVRSRRLNAEAAIHGFLERYERVLAEVSAPLSREQLADFRDPWRMVLAALKRGERERLLAGGGAVVLFAEDLAPSLAAFVEDGKVLGLVTARGGRFSHGGVLARSLGIPAVAGIADRRLRPGTTVVVNGDEGTVLVDPSPEEISSSERRRAERVALRERLRGLAREEGRTADGERVEIGANVEGLRDFEELDRATVDGVGLFRTEFVYMERREFPSEEEQVGIYGRALEAMEGRPVVFRTLDIGGDKPLPYFTTPAERNPVLGWRGLRISLQWRDLFLVQLRAILRASVRGPARILLPMVTNLEEVRLARLLLAEVKGDLARRGVPFAAEVPLGMMVEVPAAALALPHFAPEVDFVSLGTNDLVQYALAVDRDNAWVASLYEPFDPGVLALLDGAARAALAAGRPLSVCGELAGDPVAVLLLLGMGIRSFSMSPVFVAEVKTVLRGVRSEEAERMRDEALRLSTAEAVRGFLVAREREIWARQTAPLRGEGGTRRQEGGR